VTVVPLCGAAKASTLALVLWALALLGGAACSDEETPGITVQLYTPEQPELSPLPIALSKLRFSALNAGDRSLLRTQTFSVSAASADFGGIPYGDNLQLVVEGLDSTDNPIMRGASEPFSFFPDSGALGLPILMMELESFAPASTLVKAADGEYTVRQVAFQEPKPRAGHTATRLESGRILFVGGAELSDEGDYELPETVLGLGGRKLSRVFSTAEVYDPATGTFASLRPMRFERAFHTTTLLDDGRVLVVGGISLFDDVIETVKPAELYDPSTQQWTVISGGDAPDDARAWHSAVQRKSDGKVVVIGGRNMSDGEVKVLDTAEVFDPEQDAFVQNPGDEPIELRSARADHTAVLTVVGTGRGSDILIIGGVNDDGEPVGQIEVLKSLNDGDRFESDDTDLELETPRYAHASVRVTPERGNLILVVGGIGADGPLNDVEIIDLSSESVAQAGELDSARSHLQVLELPQSLDVLVLGGFDEDGDALKTAESLEYRPDTGRYSARSIEATMDDGRALHTASLLPTGLVLLAGGASGDGSLDAVEFFSPDDGSPLSPAGEGVASDGELDEDDGLLDP
jgi:hypothetical protein